MVRSVILPKIKSEINPPPHNTAKKGFNNTQGQTCASTCTECDLRCGSVLIGFSTSRHFTLNKTSGVRACARALVPKRRNKAGNWTTMDKISKARKQGRHLSLEAPFRPGSAAGISKPKKREIGVKRSSVDQVKEPSKRASRME